MIHQPTHSLTLILHTHQQHDTPALTEHYTHPAHCVHIKDFQKFGFSKLGCEFIGIKARTFKIPEISHLFALFYNTVPTQMCTVYIHEDNIEYRECTRSISEGCGGGETRYRKDGKSGIY
jgi:hypothetical protein